MYKTTCKWNQNANMNWMHKIKYITWDEWDERNKKINEKGLHTNKIHTKKLIECKQITLMNDMNAIASNEWKDLANKSIYAFTCSEQNKSTDSTIFKRGIINCVVSRWRIWVID